MPPNAQGDLVSSTSTAELPRACCTIGHPGFCVCPAHQRCSPPHQRSCPLLPTCSTPRSGGLRRRLLCTHVWSAQRSLAPVHSPWQHFANAGPPCLLVSTSVHQRGQEAQEAGRWQLAERCWDPRAHDPDPGLCPSPWVHSGKS